MATVARNTRRFPPDPKPSSLLGHPNDCVVNDYHMPEPPLFNERKRQRLEPRPPQPSETSQLVSKKRKVSHPSISQPPPAFWDNLSKIWLTKRVLRELDRRNSQSAPSPPRPPHRRARRPVTQNFLAESKRNRQAAQYAANYLHYCEPRILKDIELFTRHGGPDLSDLRNYPVSIHPSNYMMSSRQSSSQSRNRSSATTSNTKPTTNTTNRDLKRWWAGR